MALLDRIKKQDAGEMEPPPIALSGQVGANPASEDFLEQSAAASRKKAQKAAAAEAEEEDNTEFEEVCSMLLPCSS